MNFIPIIQEQVADGHWNLEQLLDREGTLSLALQNDRGQRLTLSFDSYMAYRKVDEGDALLMLSQMRKTGGTAKYFYRVEESTFVEWFNLERCAEGSVQDLIHFALAAENDIVDVLALELPIVRMG